MSASGVTMKYFTNCTSVTSVVLGEGCGVTEPIKHFSRWSKSNAVVNIAKQKGNQSWGRDRYIERDDREHGAYGFSSSVSKGTSGHYCISCTIYLWEKPNS